MSNAEILGIWNRFLDRRRNDGPSSICYRPEWVGGKWVDRPKIVFAWAVPSRWIPTELPMNLDAGPGLGGRTMDVVTAFERNAALPTQFARDDRDEDLIDEDDY